MQLFVNSFNVIKRIFKNRKNIESIEVRCSGREGHYNEENILEEIIKHSPESFHEITIYFDNENRNTLFSGSPGNLEAALSRCGNRQPLSLTVTRLHRRGP